MRKERQSKSLPDSAVHISTYDQLHRYCQAFSAGHLNLLILIGARGLGKSRSLRQAVGHGAFWIDGNATAFGIYMEAYEHRHQPIVIDDPDALYRDRDGVRLLKALCQTESLKTLCWFSDSQRLRSRGIPQQFETASHVAIIANEWKTINANVAAVEDRGHVRVFEPSATEVHCQAATWFWDQEVFDFVGAHLHLIQAHTLRTYVLAWELKQAQLDWKTFVLSRCLAGTALAVAMLKANPDLGNEEDRVRAFISSGKGCRATYFNYAKKLASSKPVAKAALLHTQPPNAIKVPEDVIEIETLYKEFGESVDE